MEQYVSFDGLPDEDSNAYIANFLEICDNFKINRLIDDAIRLYLFSFSLRNRAKQSSGSTHYLEGPLLLSTKWQRNSCQNISDLLRPLR